MIDVGTVLADRYRLGSRIAGGGMGDVYAADDTRLERPVAVKVLRGGGATSDLDRFASEIRTLAGLNHPSIVRLHDAGEHDGTPFLVMELVVGRSLTDVIHDAPHDPDVARRVGIDVAAGLAYAHGRGIVHRDVKPSNVLLDEEDRARLADFGIARLADTAGLTTTGTTLGTAAYLAPEQLTGGDIGPPADVYALGLVLLEVLTGERAFYGTTVETAFARLSQDPDIPDELPDAWRALLRSMTARDPGSRPSPVEVGEVLREGPTLEATQRLGLAPTVPLQPDGEPTARLEDAEPTVPIEGEAPVAAVTQPTVEEPDEEPAPPRRDRRAAPYLVLLVLGVVALVAILVAGVSDEPGTGEGPAADAPPETTAPREGEQPPDEDDVPGDDNLPSPLEDVVDRLEDSVTR